MTLSLTKLQSGSSELSSLLGLTLYPTLAVPVQPSFSKNPAKSVYRESPTPNVQPSKNSIISLIGICSTLDVSCQYLFSFIGLSVLLIGYKSSAIFIAFNCELSFCHIATVLTPMVIVLNKGFLTVITCVSIYFPVRLVVIVGYAALGICPMFFSLLY